MALAPGADTYFYSMAETNPYSPSNEGFLAYLTLVANQTHPPLVHSLSYGDVEAVVFNETQSGLQRTGLPFCGWQWCRIAIQMDLRVYPAPLVHAV
jgi:hypothetical protein